ncbi:MAG: ATP-dependent Clp protease ATP-binding subunit [Clostridia bacterium]|nr:ATP-dependent Clp protease ATP-binding subunit [Clostridia bacterium]MDD7701224.1 ATP-dependent Clp protease ATP-binding subunit [Eubacteriales bacterium]MDY2827535.1 ATP-dependent Clp protease ATP-binding subunit [Eubacteriales bacterium]
MVMCSRCHKRVATVFVTKVENGERKTEGFCIKCAGELGLPTDQMMGNVMGKLGITPEQLENVEEELSGLLSNADLPSNGEDGEDGGAPAIDFPRIFRESGLFGKPEQNAGQKKDSSSAKNPDKTAPEKKRKYLDTYCRNLTRRAAEGKLDRIVGRERELSRVIQILCRRQKNNPCLIGEPGVGKTAIAEALAQRIAENNVPYKLKGKEVFLVDLTALVAGTQFRGQFESRVLGLLKEVTDAGNVILVIDEVHNIVGTGESEGSVNAANILKPALSRGEVQIIGATTLNEYRKYIEKDSALERRFQPVTVNEPSLADTVEMLRGIKHYYENFHSVKIPDEILTRAVVLSERYITDRYLPDKAIDLLDEAAANLSLNSAVLNESYEIREQLLKNKDRQEQIEAKQADAPEEDKSLYEELANLKAADLRLSARLSEIEPACGQVIMSEEELAKVIEVWTGIPAATISENEYKKLDGLCDRLKTHIVGQDAAVEAVARAVKRNRAGVSYKRKPVSFIFAGPTGVGKTELVKQLAADLFDSPETLIRLDMSEFMEKHAVSRIIGAPPGYVGYDEAGQLTEKIRRRPYSVVLFDEIEKAHPDVLNILLQILDDGRITDAHGKTVNFENTVLVMTTNAGSDRAGATVGFLDAEKDATENPRTEKALSTFLRPEFLNRVDEVITFRSLDEADFSRIAGIMMNELKTALAERGITLSFTKDALSLIATRSYSHKFGARNMRRYIQDHVEDALAEKIIADYQKSITHASVSVRDGELHIAAL